MTSQGKLRVALLFGRAAEICARVDSKNCGTGAGGFKPGNTCPRGGAAGTQTNSGSQETKPKPPKKPPKKTEAESSKKIEKPDKSNQLKIWGNNRFAAEDTKKIFGDDWTPQDVTGLFGAPSGEHSFAEVGRGKDGSISVHLADSNGRFVADHSIRKTKDGEIVARVDLVKVNAQGGGLGTKMFIGQVHAMADAGVNRIELHAAKLNESGGQDAYVGYRVWPKFGFDAPLEATKKYGVDIRNSLPPHLSKAKTVQELFSISGDDKNPSGRAWWDKNGVDIDMAFDLSKGSTSRKLMAAYLKNKRTAKSKSFQSTKKSKIANIDVLRNPEDDPILDQLWDEIAKAGGIRNWASKQRDNE